MKLTMFKSKLHQMVVTEANLMYEGSITIDQDLLDKAQLLSYEKVQVLNTDIASFMTSLLIRAAPRCSRLSTSHSTSAREITSAAPSQIGGAG